MYTAISALDSYQNDLDVIANNLANANTTGYKASRVLFTDQYSQLISPGASPSTALGGVNPTQIGLGVKMGEVTPQFTQGTLQSTGNDLDMAIQGDGFFVYDQGLAQRYSRDGSLKVDANGTLVNSSTGLHVQGWMADAEGNIDTTVQPTDITINTDQAQAQTTGNAVFGGNLDSSTAVGDSVVTSIGVYDALGKLRNVDVTFTRTNATDWSWKVDATGANDTATGDGTISFTNGQNPTVTVTDAISITDSTGAEPDVNMKIDLSKLTQLSEDSSVSMTSQDGLPAGTVSSLYVSPKDGTISLVYSNGIIQPVAQLALARFTNPSGLISTGDSTYEKGLNSGEAEIGTANSGGRGTISSGSLEASNVDMAQEFTNMMLAQRGFQASSRVITTSDTLMQTLVNLIQ